MSKKGMNEPKAQMWSVLFVGAILLNLGVCTVGQSISAGTPLYIQKIGGSHAYSGLLLSAYILAAMGARFASGQVADARSRRFVMLIGSGSVVIGSLLPIFIPFEPILFVSRIFQGIGFSCAQTAASAYAADVLPYRRLGEGIGYFGLGQALSMAIGPAFAVWLVSLEYSEALTLGIALVGLAMFVLCCFVRYEKNPRVLPEEASYRIRWEKRQAHKEKQVNERVVSATPSSAKPIQVVDDLPSQENASGKPAKKDGFNRYFEKAARFGAIPAIFFAATSALFISYTTVYAQAMGYENPGFFFALAAVMAVAIRLVSAKSMDTSNLLKVFLVPVVAGCIVFLVMGFVQNEYAFYFCGIGYGICVGLSIPLLNAVAVKASPPERYGAANSLFFLLYDVGFGIGVVGWGFVIDYWGFSALFIGGIACLVISFILAARLFPKVP